MGLLFVTFISWIPNHAASYLGDLSDIAGGALYSIMLSARSLPITVWFPHTTAWSLPIIARSAPPPYCMVLSHYCMDPSHHCMVRSYHCMGPSIIAWSRPLIAWLPFIIAWFPPAVAW